MSKQLLLSESDYTNAAEKLGCQVAAIKAVAAVESNGTGFIADGRPKILFERHVFRKSLIAAGITPPNNLPNIVHATAGGYSRTSETEYARLGQAAEINRDCALKSASWGAFQIMGYNWASMQYRSLQDFINAMWTDAPAQLDAFVRFIKADKNLLQAIRDTNFTRFARAYNGPKYRDNQYDTKMEKAFMQAGGRR